MGRKRKVGAYKRSYTLDAETIAMIDELKDLQHRDSLTNVIENAVKNEYRRETDGKRNSKNS